MFENRADIQPFLAETELGLFAAEIACLCKPSLCFEPSAAQVGGTRLVTSWTCHPTSRGRSATRAGAALAARLAGRGEGVASRFTVPAPLDFVCQVDLTDRAVTLTSGRKVLTPSRGRVGDPRAGRSRFTTPASADGFLRLFDRSPTEAEAEACSREVPAWTMLLLYLIMCAD